ncbi:MAG: DJ-1/PfpI family protein [Reichenbachiella sp.]|uniref:DJ-1/PfpI family protein n=1 Tax=Reichenbachiella sp. TaxID=2184521 RepID=UPI002966DBD3|nr:DJ-1/PfpI family protein [Reichenbachiella sp.]MDW3208496.1 DJ-1/PfpI family protein [Reichenbachiella sp.]
MIKYMFGLGFLLAISISSCEQKVASQETTYINKDLPTIGIIIFDAVITNEILAPLDVFSKHTANGEKLFNVIFIAAEQRAYKTEEGMRMLPDFSFENTPDLDVLVIPSSYKPAKQYKDPQLVGFVNQQYDQLDYVATHCAGAFTLAASGKIDNKELVTYITGGESLQKEFPNLKVQDDAVVSVARDGKVFSSNGSLVSYLGSLDLLEALTSSEHRKYVEGSLYLDRLIVSN